MSDLLEDPDGAPYPEEVQVVWRELPNHVLGEFELTGMKSDLVAALEAVAANAWDRSAEETAEWISASGHPGPNGPPDPPRNPHERRPPPVPKTPEEKRAFSRDWDARYEAGRSKRADQG